jgi:hypothetical protein
MSCIRESHSHALGSICSHNSRSAAWGQRDRLAAASPADLRREIADRHAEVVPVEVAVAPPGFDRLVELGCSASNTARRRLAVRKNLPRKDAVSSLKSGRNRSFLRFDVCRGETDCAE